MVFWTIFGALSAGIGVIIQILQYLENKNRESFEKIDIPKNPFAPFDKSYFWQPSCQKIDEQEQTYTEIDKNKNKISIILIFLGITIFLCIIYVLRILAR